MTVIGFHFKKMSAEKKKTPTGKINVTNNVVLTEVKEAKINVGSAKQKGIEFSFHYKIRYEPSIASVDLEGAVIFLSTEAKVKETMDMWKKEKRLPSEVMQEVYNDVLSRCNIEGLMIGRDMQLPPHMPMPKVTAEDKK